MIIIFSLDLPNFEPFMLLILYMFFSRFDLIFCIIFILVRQNQQTFCHLHLESQGVTFIVRSQLLFILQVPISIGKWHEVIGNFNSYKCTSTKTELTNFMVYLSLYKLIIIICLCYIHDFLNYCVSFSGNIYYLLIILITDNSAIQVNNLLTPVISVFKSLKTKLIRISYSLQYCLILHYLIELSLKLVSAIF